MPGAVASGPAATAPSGAAPQERGWGWFVVGLVLMVLVTAAPAWPGALALPGAAVRLLLPVEQFALLVLAAIAACAAIGWWSGGTLLMALLWAGAAGWVLWRAPLPAAGYGAFVRGWALCLAAAFGLVCLASPARAFLSRALGALLLAGTVTLFGVTAGEGVAGEPFAPMSQVLVREYQQRLDGSLQVWRERAASPTWRGFAERFPEAAARAGRMEGVLVALAEPAPATSGAGSGASALVRLAPALLALESLMALALGWAAYHRLARARIGPPLGALRDLRFNDQLVWGVVVGATILLLPTLSAWRTAGINLVAFFGTLYALRGAGVVTWWVPDRFAGWVPLGLVLLVPLLGAMWFLLALLAVTFALGLGDTWRDFRAGARARRRTS